jgi:hypothetical protein
VERAILPRPGLPCLPCPALSNGVAAVAAVAERDGKAGGVMWRRGCPHITGWWWWAVVVKHGSGDRSRVERAIPHVELGMGVVETRQWS